MKIGLCYDIKCHAEQTEGLSDDAYEEYDSPETVEALSVAIRLAGHQVTELGGGVTFLEQVLREKPDHQSAYGRA